MSKYLESIDSGWSESLKGVSMEIHSVKKQFLLISLEKIKLLKPQFIKEILEFDCSENGKVFGLT